MIIVLTVNNRHHYIAFITTTTITITGITNTTQQGRLAGRQVFIHVCLQVANGGIRLPLFLPWKL